MADWMAGLPSRTTRKPITQLYIPGSENSCSFNLDESDEVGCDLSKPVRTMASLTIGKEALARWMQHQSVNLETQLSLGVRYLHIKVVARDGEIFALNGLHCGKIKDHMHTIHRFLVEHRKEIVFIHFTDFLNFSSKDFSTLGKLLQLQFNDLLLHRESEESLSGEESTLVDITVQSLWKWKKQVIVLADSDSSPDCPFVWQHSVSKYVTEAQKLSIVCKDYEEEVKDMEKDEKVVRVFAATVSLSISRALERPFGSFEKEYGRPTTRELQEWIKKKAITLPPFVVSTHFVDETRFCHSIIDLNS